VVVAVREHLQQPPAFSAKKVAGTAPTTCAPSRRACTLSPVPVRVSRADVLAYADGRARITLTCSAGSTCGLTRMRLDSWSAPAPAWKRCAGREAETFDIEEATSLEALQRAPESAPG
jgi:tRNA U55 pseudouridine synthase TruB